MKIFKNIYTYVISVLFTIIIGFLVYIAYKGTCYNAIQYTSEYTFFLKDNVLLNILFSILFIVFVYFLSKSKIVSKINNDDKLFKKLEIILLVLIFIVGAIWVWGIEILPESDQYFVLKAVAEFKNGDYSSFESGSYMEMCTNQIGIFFIYYLLSFVLGDNLYLGLQLVNALAVVLIYKSLSDIVCILKGNNFIRLAIIFSAFVFPVLIIYCWLIYGNMLGIAFILLSIKYELIYFDEYRIKDLVLSTFFLIIALMAKSFTLVYLIGMFIYALFKITQSKNIKGFLIIVCFIMGLLFELYVPKLYVESKVGHSLDGASYFSYIAMGMQEGDRCEGWHNKYNQDSYHLANNDSNVQKKMALKEINERLSIFSKDSIYALKFYSRKIISQWNNPTFGMYYGMDSLTNDEFMYRFGDGYNHSKYFDRFLNLGFEDHVQTILNVEQSLIVLGCLLYIIFFFFRNDRSLEELLLPLCFIGGFLFLIIWEAKSQYALMFYVILFIYALFGYRDLINILNKQTIFDKKKIIIALVIGIVLIVTYNLLFNKDYLYNDNVRYKEYLACGNTYDWFNK